MNRPLKDQQPSPEPNTHEDENLKGTLVSVLILGVFMVVSWFGVYGLFLSR